MPITIDIMANPFLCEAFEKGQLEGRQAGEIALLCRQLEQRSDPAQFTIPRTPIHPLLPEILAGALSADRERQGGRRSLQTGIKMGARAFGGSAAES